MAPDAAGPGDVSTTGRGWLSEDDKDQIRSTSGGITRQLPPFFIPQMGARPGRR
jgi:hypothetical protein